MFYLCTLKKGIHKWLWVLHWLIQSPSISLPKNLIVEFHFFRYFEDFDRWFVILTMLVVRKMPCSIFCMLNGRVWDPCYVCSNENHPPISFHTYHRLVHCLFLVEILFWESLVTSFLFSWSVMIKILVKEKKSHYKIGPQGQECEYYSPQTTLA